jgi:hypothetical protein
MTETAAEITIRELDEGAPTRLLCVYPREQRPQPCYIALDLRDGQVWADYDGEVGTPPAVPATVWHGIVRRYTIPPLQAAEANALMRELRPLLERVYRGGDIEWDGSNHRGVLSADALAAEAEIESVIERDYSWGGGGGTVAWVQAHDWLEIDQELRARLLSDEPLETIAADLDGDGLSEDRPVLIGLENYLQAERERLQAEASDA